LEELRKLPYAPEELAMTKGWARRAPPGDIAVGAPIAPNGDGYMSFWGALHWVASQGGRVEVTADQESLREAFNDLIDEIANEKVRIIGNQNGAPSPIRGIDLLDVKMLLFWDDSSSLPGHPNAPFIQLSPIPWNPDNEDRQREFNDQLFVGGYPRYSH